MLELWEADIFGTFLDKNKNHNACTVQKNWHYKTNTVSTTNAKIKMLKWSVIKELGYQQQPQFLCW